MFFKSWFPHQSEFHPRCFNVMHETHGLQLEEQHLDFSLNPGLAVAFVLAPSIGFADETTTVKTQQSTTGRFAELNSAKCWRTKIFWNFPKYLHDHRWDWILPGWTSGDTSTFMASLNPLQSYFKKWNWFKWILLKSHGMPSCYTTATLSGLRASRSARQLQLLLLCLKYVHRITGCLLFVVLVVAQCSPLLRLRQTQRWTSLPHCVLWLGSLKYW